MHAWPQQVWDFGVQERTRPLQQYAACFPKKVPYFGRVTGLHTVDDEGDGALAAVRTCHSARALTFRIHSHACCCAQISTGGGTLTVLDPATCKALFTTTGAHVFTPGSSSRGSASITALRLSPTGRHVATAGVDAAVRVWETGEGRQALCLVGHAAAPTTLLWSPDGRTLLSGGGSDALRVWRVPLSGID